MLNKLFPILLLATLPASAFSASSNTHITIRQIFAEGGATAGFYPSTVNPACAVGGIYYIDLGTAAGEARFTLAVLAKAKNLTISRVDYTINSSDNSCWVTGLHICKEPDCI